MKRISIAGKSPRRRGAVIVLTVASLIGLLGFVALTVDVGYIYDINAEMQDLADAAALAGASALGDKDSGLPQAYAEEIIARNLKNFGYTSTQDHIIQLGTWDSVKQTFTVGPDESANAVLETYLRLICVSWHTPVLDYPLPS